MSTHSLMRSIDRFSQESSAANLASALTAVGWPDRCLEIHYEDTGSAAVVASLAGQPQVVLASGGSLVTGAGPISLGYSSEAPYTLVWDDDLMALHETARWWTVPGDAPLFADHNGTAAAKANLLELVAPERLAADEPVINSLTRGRAQPDLAEGLGLALADLRKAVVEPALWEEDRSQDQRLLRLFHQLLFVRFYEDRNPRASFERIENSLYAAETGAHLTDLLDRYSRMLRSELFTRDAFSVMDIPATALKRVLLALTEPWAQLRLDFRLTPNDVSGRLYETYLGKQPSLQREEGTLFPLVGTVDDRSQRGSFYTPTAVATQLAKSVLDPWLESERPAHPSHIKVLDPACGSGAFLLAAYRILQSYFEQLYGRPLEQVERRDLLSSSIFGADLDEAALMLAQVALYEEADLGVDSQLPAMGRNLILGDSLLSPPGRSAAGGVAWSELIAAQGKFDVILANPPFGAQRSQSSKVASQYRVALRSIYPESHSWGADLAFYFVDLSFQLLAPGGVAGFVLPRKLVSGSSSAKIRSLVAERGVMSIEDYRGAHLFPNVSAYVCLLTVGGPGGERVVVSEAIDSRINSVLLLDASSRVATMRRDVVPRNVLPKATSWTAFELRWQRLRDQINQPWMELGNSGLVEVASGTQTGANSRFVVDVPDASKKTLQINGLTVPKTLVPQWVRGPDIQPFRISAPSTRRVVLPLRSDTSEGRKLGPVIQALGGRPVNVQLGRLDLWTSPKVLLRSFSREPVAAADPLGSMISPKGTAGAFALKPTDSSGISLDGLVALLNSAFCQWWLRGVGDPRNDETVELSEAQLKRMPLPIFDDAQWEALEAAGSNVLLTLSLEDDVDRALAWWDARRSLDELVFGFMGVRTELREMISNELLRQA